MLDIRLIDQDISCPNVNLKERNLKKFLMIYKEPLRKNVWKQEVESREIVVIDNLSIGYNKESRD